MRNNLGLSLREVFVGKDWYLCKFPSRAASALWGWDHTGKEQNPHLFPTGGYIFVFFVLLLVFFAFRNFYRIGAIAKAKNENDGTLSKKYEPSARFNLVSTFCLLGIIFYFAILSFARNIYPYIPAVKGGGDYTMSHPVQLAFDVGASNSIPQYVRNENQSNHLILLDANSSCIFLATTNDAGGPEKWRSTTNRPTVFEIRREAVISIAYLNSTNFDSGTNTIYSAPPAGTNHVGQPLSRQKK
jgi:hypothetical protein